MPLYVDALTAELARLEAPRPVDTIFIGGGTPTHLPIRELSRVLVAIQQWLPLNTGGEFSIESNPESLNAETCQLLADAGVTRVSVGVQSFQSSLLEFCFCLFLSELY